MSTNSFVIMKAGRLNTLPGIHTRVSVLPEKRAPEWGKPLPRFPPPSSPDPAPRLPRRANYGTTG